MSAAQRTKDGSKIESYLDYMRSWTIGKRVTLGFASVLIIVLALGGFAYSRLLVIQGHSDRIIKQSLPTIRLIYRAQKNAKDSGQIVYQHIGSSEKDDMAHLEDTLKAGSADNAIIYEELEKLVTSTEGKQLLAEVKSARAEYNACRGEVLAVSREGTNNSAAYNLARTRLDPAAAKYVTALEAMIDFIQADTDEASKNIQSAVQGSLAGILGCLSLALVVGSGVAFIIIRGVSSILRKISRSLSEGSSQVATASAQVSAASQTLAEGSSEQAASLEETSSSLEQMASMTKRNAENAGKANEIAKLAREAADKGVNDMKTMSSAMDAIQGSSDDIAKIIKTIDEIAFQTNILALNAAVEAARAGEAGMGFAVVADEVRNLEQRCSQAAKETASKIESAIARTVQGVEISGKVAQGLSGIVGTVRQVDELVSEVTSGSREQAEGITQINRAVGQMDKVTQSNAASAEESAAAAQELSAQAEVMKESVAELLQLVGGRGNVAGQRQAERKREAKPVGGAVRPVKRVTFTGASKNQANGLAHAAFEAAVATAAKPGSAIPMENDFRDF